MSNLNIAVFACVGLAASAASADMVSFAGDSSASAEMTGCNFLAELAWSYGGGSAGTLTIDMTNTTPGPVGGFLTGFVFNIDSSDAGATATLFSTTDPDFLNTGTEFAGPFGTYEAGAALDADWSGGGVASRGIAIGGTETFVFNVTASDASSLTAGDFALEGTATYNFVTRFRGLADGRSDKVPVPTPGGLALLSLGGLIASRRSR